MSNDAFFGNLWQQEAIYFYLDANLVLVPRDESEKLVWDLRGCPEYI